MHNMRCAQMLAFPRAYGTSAAVGDQYFFKHACCCPVWLFCKSGKAATYSISKLFVSAKAKRGQFRCMTSEDYEVHG